MIHRVHQRKFSRDTNARKALFKNLANDLILHERLVTTLAKAKSLRPIVEKLITKSRENSLVSRRFLLSKLGRENSVDKLLEVFGPIFLERPGGYLRISRINPRPGDQAQMAVIEFVENISEIAAKKKIESKKEAKSEAEKPVEPAKKTPKAAAVRKSKVKATSGPTKVKKEQKEKPKAKTK